MNDLARRMAALSPEQRALLELRLKQQNLVTPQQSGIPKRMPTEIVPLSPAQERLWILHQLEPDRPIYNESIVFRLRGQLNLTFLENSLNQILQRHEILRTCIRVCKGQPTQVIEPIPSLRLPVIDLQDEEAVNQAYQIQQIITEQSGLPFDLTQAPLLRGLLIRLTTQEHIVLLTLHHLISDGGSWKVLFQELTLLYRSFCSGCPAALEDLPIQYGDFALWQRQRLQSADLKPQLAYWKQQLQNAPQLSALPLDHSRPAVQTFQGARQALTLPDALTVALKALGQKEHTTLFTVLLSVFKILLYRYSGSQDIVVGTPVTHRSQLEVERLIG
ncbi:MAG: non-ribosomal peptide synthetase, partial [Leptolyngbyaceae cyanobacterium CRU_2_3]|nr:non-ribosomal peptide synthetase [Leptolyngbyaceae cyanobacterium CRU_2_3]